MNPIEIYANGQKVSTLALEATIGRAHLSRAHADARFFANEQFRLKPTASGWTISPVPGTVNPTLLNNALLLGPQPVASGMTVKVRGANGLVLELRIPSTPATHSAPVPASPVSFPTPAARIPDAPPRPAVMPHGNLASTIFTLQDILNRIEANSGQAQQHRSNATLANAGAAITYLLTSGSKRRTVRTVGGIAALGGVLYGSSQSNQAANLDAQNNTLMDSGLSVIELEGLSNLRSETNPDAVHRFLELVLRLGAQVDDVIKRQGSRMKNMSLLGRSKQQLLLDALHIDIIANKLRLHRIYNQIDRTKTFPDYAGEFTRKVSGINAAKLQKEGLYARIIIGVLVVLGIILTNASPAAAALLLVGLGFWGFNHFFPVFPETKKLRNALNTLIDGLQNQPTIHSLTVT
ncbi:MAG: hypothetical protein WCO56_00935 [Verrucomicrobiota bacterium]